MVQHEPDGTGGAVRAAHDVVRDSDTVVVLSGDHPLINAEIVAALLETHRAAKAGATVMTVELDDPGAYGRIVRDDDGDIERIVETKDPAGVDPEILAIGEINTGTYAFAAEPLVEALDHLRTPTTPPASTTSATCCRCCATDGHRVVAHVATDPNVNLGVNNRADLAPSPPRRAGRSSSATCSPASRSSTPPRTWIDAEVEIAADATIEPGTVLRGAHLDRRRLDHRAALDADRHDRRRAVARDPAPTCTAPTVGNSPSVGPFAYLRPAPSSTRAPRPAPSSRSRTPPSATRRRSRTSSYVGDAEVGAGANVGAGTITANYDGATSTGRRSGKVRGSASTTRWSLR